MSSAFETEYLGDSVYIEFDGYGFKIYTCNGTLRQNEMYLEPEVMMSLVKFAAKSYADDRIAVKDQVIIKPKET